VLICVTGPECSGKTTLKNYLSLNLQIPSVEEFAREYLTKSAGHYTFEDLDVIAQGQLDAMSQNAGRETPVVGDEEKSVNKGIVITDTFLLVILIWSLHKYGRVSATVKELYSANQPDFYLLCKPDLTWEYDQLRESQDDRDALFEKYLEHIHLAGIPYYIVEGSGEERMRKALHRVKSLIQKKLP
jgi:nicotinamide riboside kinase